MFKDSKDIILVNWLKYLAIMFKDSKDIILVNWLKYLAIMFTI